MGASRLQGLRYHLKTRGEGVVRAIVKAFSRRRSGIFGVQALHLHVRQPPEDDQQREDGHILCTPSDTELHVS